MNELELREKLSSLKRDPLYQIILPYRVAKDFYNTKEICNHISSIIWTILEKTYKPLGLWLQNPDTEGIRDEGVVIENDWNIINYGDTNYCGWMVILDSTHKFFIDYCRLNKVNKLTIFGVEFSIYEDFRFDENSIKDIKSTKEKIKKLLVLTYYFKDSIFHPKSEICKRLLNLMEKTSKRGKEAEDFFELHIDEFFGDMVSYEKTKGKGDYNDRKQGVDYWVTRKVKKTTINVKSVKNIDDSNDDLYIIDVAISETSKCDKFVFVRSDDSEILMFRNDKLKIIRNYNNQGMGFPSILLDKKISYVK